MAALALTFDDGPDRRWTPRVLDALAAEGAHATFFVIAARAAAEPAVVARAVAEGHRVELHCDEHVRHSARDRAWAAFDADVALARLSALGIRPRLWRTPWGDRAEWSAELAAERGLRLVDWSADTHDWRGDDAAAMLDATAARLHDGAVVLCHDGLGPGARRADCAETVAFVHRAAAFARGRGLALAPLADDGSVG
ncbi:polysaccharide deacetylase family protein [Conexibacter stalactiti]|uniref:Polysaccharide deacetylase family protein n=1 Tax=Conexibacter stalactiti TaxID=1940611 RepID=A0ABU4HZE3_9ACTN|nr:polysaccharide deacetylase family protein [Conexibacter stalactiti]MDW5598588.1 polysaccharide deacetylase family protein [Conexibacter stalactiti]MEC5039230.1 polysaccharide deacetylase family protein [Conexibacter stalactiti]